MRGVVDRKYLIEMIRAEMDRRMLTQVEVARMAGVNRQRVWTVLQGQSLSIPTIRKMWHALGLKLEKPNAKG